MAVYAQTACTLSTITDVTAVYTYYYLSSSTITNNMAPKDNVNPPDETHNAGSRQVTVTYGGNSYVWKDIDPNINISDGDAVGLLYYIECVKFSDGTYDWGPLMTSSAYAAAKAAYNLSSQALGTATEASNAIALLGGHFTYSGFTATTLTPHSANVIEYASTSPASWKHNVHIGSTGIALRYNETTLSKWYVDNSNNTTIQLGKDSNQRFIINTSSIQAYNSSNQKYFEVNANGLTYGTGNTAVASQTELTNEINARKAIYGTCSTVAATSPKIIVCDNFSVYTGAKLTIKFTYANSVVNPSFTIQNSSGSTLLASKSTYNANAATSSSNPLLWGPNTILTFVYDGARWVLEDKAPTYSISCSTSATSSPKTASVDGVLIINGTTIDVNFSTANTYTSGTLQFNLSNTGETDIYVDNVTTSSSKHLVWNANTILSFTRQGSKWLLTSRGDASDVYAVEVKVNSIDYTTNQATLVAIPTYKGTTLPSGASVTYQWYKNTIDNTGLISGANSSTLSVTDLDAIYICVISN